MGGGGRSRRWWLSQVALAALWVSASVGVWVAVHWYMRKVGMSRAAETLVVMCEERARMLQDQFAVSVNHVHALAALVSAFHVLKEPSNNHQEMFAYYTAKTAYYTARTAFERSLLDGVAYAQRLFIQIERSLRVSKGGQLRPLSGSTRQNKKNMHLWFILKRLYLMLLPLI